MLVVKVVPLETNLSAPLPAVAVPVIPLGFHPPALATFVVNPYGVPNLNSPSAGV